MMSANQLVFLSHTFRYLLFCEAGVKNGLEGGGVFGGRQIKVYPVWPSLYIGMVLFLFVLFLPISLSFFRFFFFSLFTPLSLTIKNNSSQTSALLHSVIIMSSHFFHVFFPFSYFLLALFIFFFHAPILLFRLLPPFLQYLLQS